jgi:hypothetical protein
MFHDAFKRYFARVIFAIRDDDQNLLVFLRLLLKVVQRHLDRVAHRSAAP